MQRQNIDISSVRIWVILSMLSAFASSAQKKETHNPPVVNYNMSYLCFNDTVYFTNKSESTSPLTFTWTIFEDNFEDTVFVSNDQDIRFKFPHVDAYIIQLDAFNGHYTTSVRNIYVDSVTRAGADYQACPSRFINVSSCAGSFFWDFGDSTTSTEESPLHSYKVTGPYNVKLRIRNGSVYDSTEIYIDAYASDLTGKFRMNYNNDTLYTMAIDSSRVDFINYIWTWGDGSKSSGYDREGQRQKHVYNKIGKDSIYTIFLLEKGYCDVAFGQDGIFIHDSTIVTSTRIYPNPVTSPGTVKIECNDKRNIEKVELTDNLGQKIKALRLVESPNGLDVDFSNLPQGTYVLRVYIGSEIITKRIVKI